LKSHVQQAVIELGFALNDDGIVGCVELNDSDVCEKWWVRDIHVVSIDFALEVSNSKPHLVIVHQVHQLGTRVKRERLEFKVGQVERD
jgi:hypothetical protein